MYKQALPVLIAASLLAGDYRNDWLAIAAPGQLAPRATPITNFPIVQIGAGANFSLTILQKAANLSTVIARISLKAKRGGSYSPETLIGDFRYKINQRANFIQGLNEGDLVVVRLYDQKNHLIGYSEFELLAENVAVNLILPDQPLSSRLLLTFYGANANLNGKIDDDAHIYGYFTQISADGQNVHFLSALPVINNISQFKIVTLPPLPQISYPPSLATGAFFVVNRTNAIFDDNTPGTLTNPPGQQTAIRDLSADQIDTYNVSQLIGKFKAIALGLDPNGSFRDVPNNYWAKDFIAQLVTRGIIQGFPDGTFRPNAPVTRGQFAAMVNKAFRRIKIRDAVTFADVPSNYWGYQIIQQDYEMGFFEGGVNFGPNQKIYRWDSLTVLTKGLNYSVQGTTEQILQVYQDGSQIPSNVREAIAAATEKGIVVNYPNRAMLKPNQLATRAEVAALIYQALVSTGDASAISSPYVVGKN